MDIFQRQTIPPNQYLGAYSKDGFIDMTLQGSCYVIKAQTLKGNWLEKRLRNLGLRNAAAHPEGDSQSERGVQSVKQVMCCLLEDS